MQVRNLGNRYGIDVQQGIDLIFRIGTMQSIVMSLSAVDVLSAIMPDGHRIQ